MKNKSTPESGFTLVEILIAIVVIAILGTATLSLLSSTGSLYNKIHYDSNSENEARIALSYITIKVRQNDFTYHDGGSIVNSVKLIDQSGKILTDDDMDGKITGKAIRILDAGFLDTAMSAEDLKEADIWRICFNAADNNLSEYYFKNQAAYDSYDGSVPLEGCGPVSEGLDDVTFTYDSDEKLLSFTIVYHMEDGAKKTLDGMVYLRSE
jgi:prepilin-type N-terminal cleavage/methylation domain-containing protein